MTEEKGESVGHQFQRSLRRLFLATAVLYLVLGGLAVKVYFDTRNTHNALCTFRHDLKVRVRASVQFLAEHPNGTPGIPARVILEGISNQQRTISALDALQCSER